MIEYEKMQGKNILILPRKRESKFTNLCPFCRDKHIHGKGDGHRLAHCGDLYFKGKKIMCKVNYAVITDDGTLLKADDGYIIREY